MGEHPIHEHARASCALHSRFRLGVHGVSPRLRASTGTLCAAQVGIAHGSMGEHPIQEHSRAYCSLHRQELPRGPWGSTPSTRIHEHPVRCTGGNCPGVHGAPRHHRASTSILCDARVGIAHGPMREHAIHEHARAYCALHRWQSLIGGTWEGIPSTIIRDHIVRCTGRLRPLVHRRASHPRASTIIFCAAQAGTAHWPMGDRPIHEHPRAPCALHR